MYLEKYLREILFTESTWKILGKILGKSSKREAENTAFLIGGVVTA